MNQSTYKPPSSRAILVKMYDSGMTQAEIAQELGTSQKRIFTAMRRMQIPRRRSVKRSQAGEANNAWRGDDASYTAKHARVYRQRGQPMFCSVCGTTDAAKAYDWANVSGNYNDPKDYARMCRSCHRKFDRARRSNAT